MNDDHIRHIFERENVALSGEVLKTVKKVLREESRAENHPLISPAGVVFSLYRCCQIGQDDARELADQWKAVEQATTSPEAKVRSMEKYKTYMTHMSKIGRALNNFDNIQFKDLMINGGFDE